MKTIIGLVAVRSGSTRLPNKAFLDLCGQPMLGVLIDRLQRTDALDDVVVCTTTAPADDRIEQFCRDRGVACFRGEVSNVLKRFTDALAVHPAQYAVRITGDNPLTDFETMKEAFAYIRSQGGDYTRQVGVPVGTACEIIRAEKLRELLRRTPSAELTEYMTYFFEMAPFIKNTLYRVGPDVTFPDLRLTIDYQADLDNVANMIRDHGNAIPPLSEIVTYFRRKPDYPRVTVNLADVETIKQQIRFI